MISMNSIVIASLVFGILLAVGHYFSEYIHLNYKKYNLKIISFTAGISVAYLFLYLFPELYTGVSFLTRLIFLFVLLGFSLVHVIEKHAYHHKSTKILKNELKHVHASSFFVYHVLIGVSLVILTEVSIVNGFLFFIPIFLHTTISSISLKELHEDVRTHGPAKIVLSLSSLIGVLIGLFFPVETIVFNAILGFIVGALLYIIVRDSLPPKDFGYPSYFLLGIVLYIILLFAFFR